MRPVIPRWTIHCASDRCRDAACRVWSRAARLPFFVSVFVSVSDAVRKARDSPSRSNTMCLPARLTRMIRLPSSVAAMTPAGDLSGCLLGPIQTDSTVSPEMRLSKPRTMVSTSGSSGTLSGYKIGAASFCSGRFAASRTKSTTVDTEDTGGIPRIPVCPSTVRLGMLERTHQAPPIFPGSQVFSTAAAQPVCATLGRAAVCGRAIFQVEFSLSRGSTSRGRTAVIVGAQWGDEGKGKIVDVLTQTFSVVARYAGGHNAGHTVIINGKKFILQLVPGGILRPECTSVVGNGVVIDPLAFLKEVASLRAGGVKVDSNLFVSNRAQVILPYHRMMELGSENAPGRVKIGTTSRGIGPTYEDKMGRRGLRVADLLDTALLRTHIENACREKNMIAHALFNSEPLDADKMFREYADAAEQIRPF